MVFTLGPGPRLSQDDQFQDGPIAVRQGHRDEIKAIGQGGSWFVQQLQGEGRPWLNVVQDHGIDEAVTGCIDHDLHRARGHRRRHGDLDARSRGGIRIDHRIRTRNAGRDPSRGLSERHDRGISPGWSTRRPGNGQSNSWSIDGSQGGGLAGRIRRGNRGRIGRGGYGGVD